MSPLAAKKVFLIVLGACKIISRRKNKIDIYVPRAKKNV